MNSAPDGVTEHAKIRGDIRIYIHGHTVSNRSEIFSS